MVGHGAAGSDGKADDRHPSRLFRRYDMGLPATLEYAGAVTACRIANISLGGAAITPGPPGMMGRAVLLRAPDAGLAGTLVATVVHIEGDRAALRFDLDPIMEDALTFFLMASAPTC